MTAATMTSVVIPAHDAERTLAAAVGSVLGQTHDPLRVVIVDDGSTDGTLELARALAARDRRIAVHHQENRGPAAARNTGIRAGGGPLVGFLDSDDLWHPSFLTLMTGALEANPSAAIAYTDAWVFDDRNGRLRRRSAMGRQTPPQCGELDGPQLTGELLERNFMWVSTVVRRSALEQVGLFDESVPWGVEDHELWLRLAAHGFGAVRVLGRLGYYRSHGTQISRDMASMAEGTTVLMGNALASHRLTDDQRATAQRRIVGAQREVRRFTAPSGRQEHARVARHRLGTRWAAGGGPLHWRGTVPLSLLDGTVLAERGGRVTVLTLIDGIGMGGAERLAAEVAARLDRGRFRSVLCVTRTPADGVSPEHVAAREALRAAGVLVITLQRRSTGDLKAWAPLVRLLRSGEVDVLHAHKFGSNVWGALLGRAFGVPAILAHEHTWSFRGHPVRRLLDRHLVGRAADRVLAVTEADRHKLLTVTRLPAELVQVVPNGIAAPATGPAPTPAVVPANGRDPVLLAVGVLRRQKAFDVLIQATALLRQVHPGLHTLIAGGIDPFEAAEPGRLEALVTRLGLERHVTMLGPRSDVADLLAEADVAVCCSAYEGSPLAVMEAMEAGTPVVASRVGGLPDLIEDGVHGRLVAPGDPADLARGISAALADRPAALRMAAQAQVRRRREFDVDVTVRRLQDLYLELLQRPRRRRPPWVRQPGGAR
jgi:glycosyltransferase involved in cell wall biosynthesis/GT2 family glycosyltransferase